MPEKVGHWKCLVNLAAPWGWGTGRDLELHCEVVIILAENCSKTKQHGNHTTSRFYYYTKLGKIAGVLQLRCHQ